MTPDTPYACIRNDHGMVAEIVHVSPIFMRCGPPRRGTFDERRLARARRTDARQQRRAAPVDRVETFDRFSRSLS